ncbi:MAG: GH92 family glycosyl hydrolase [Luteolibacter sp.]
MNLTKSHLRRFHLLVATTLLCSLSFSSADPVDEVNVFLGSDSSAQCSPAAIRPFGMISPGPFNQPEAPCGYSHRVKQVLGFNHTHLQGTGCGSYGVITLLPVSGARDLGFKAKSSPDKRSGEPGYFKAELDDEGITAEMTCTKRAAIHRYSYPENAKKHRVLLDLSQAILYTGKGEFDGEVKPVGDRALEGYARTTAWGEHKTWFFMEFNTPIKFEGKGKKGAIIDVMGDPKKPVLVKLGISYVSEKNARENLQAEIPGWDFDGVKADARKEWNQKLSKLAIEGGTPDQRVNFHTAHYHALFHPQLASDVNGEYRGLDSKVRKTAGHNHYTVLSTWDTFRAAHPLYTLIEPELQLDVIKTIIDDYKDSGWGPRWKLAYKEVFCMPGTWCDIIIPDAYIKGIRDFDTQAAWELIEKNATVEGRRVNVADYETLGYVPYPTYINVTHTMESAYLDFSIARFAEALGKNDKAAEFDARSLKYRTLWDSNTGFFRGRDKKGDWSYPDTFDPLTYTGKGNDDYCEGNAWQWLWHVMHDTQGLAALMGGEAGFRKKLDEFFVTEGGDAGGHHDGAKDFGQYWHGNEPDQHAIYCYNYAGQPAKTAELVRAVLDKEYRNDTWGISGNEDAGQMSAWYLFSALGFYPYLHSVPEYTIGTPLFDKATLNLPGGKVVITAKNNSAENKYIQSMTINGKPWDKNWLPHSVLQGDSTIEFVMGPKPSDWGTSPQSRPYSLTPANK